MGIMSIVKNVIEHFRKAGKTENEISGMIEQAADRAEDALQKKRNIKDRKSRSKHRQNSSSRQSCKWVSQRSR